MPTGSNSAFNPDMISHSPPFVPQAPTSLIRSAGPQLMVRDPPAYSSLSRRSVRAEVQEAKLPIAPWSPKAATRRTGQAT